MKQRQQQLNEWQPPSYNSSTDNETDDDLDEDVDLRKYGEKDTWQNDVIDWQTIKITIITTLNIIFSKLQKKSCTGYFLY